MSPQSRRRSTRPVAQAPSEGARGGTIWVPPRLLDLHHLRLLARSEGVDPSYLGVRDLLQLLSCPPCLVLGKLPCPFLLVDLLQLVTADVTNGPAPLLGALPDHLHVLPSALLGQWWNGHPDDLAVVGRVEAVAGVANRLLDRRELAAVVDLDHEQARFGGGDLGQLVQRRRCPVVGPSHVLDQDRVGAAGPDGL